MNNNPTGKNGMTLCPWNYRKHNGQWQRQPNGCKNNPWQTLTVEHGEPANPSNDTPINHTIVQPSRNTWHWTINPELQSSPQRKK